MITRYLKTYRYFSCVLVILGGLTFGFGSDVMAQEGTYVGNEQPQGDVAEHDGSGMEYLQEEEYSPDNDTVTGTTTYQSDHSSENQEIKRATTPTATVRKSKKVESNPTRKEADSMLSFNFIYYILQKFKFSDRYE